MSNMLDWGNHLHLNLNKNWFLLFKKYMLCIYPQNYDQCLNMPYVKLFFD